MSLIVFARVPVDRCYLLPLGVVNGCAAKLRFQVILCLCVDMCRSVCVFLETQETVECPGAGVTCYWMYMVGIEPGSSSSAVYALNHGAVFIDPEVPLIH